MLALALPARAQVIFDNEFLLQEVEGSWIIDAGDDVQGNVSLQFGNTLGETLTFNTTESWFELSNDLNLNQNQIKDIVIDNLSVAPSTPLAGQIYHNTTDNNTYIYNGISWEDITSGTGGSQDFEDVYSADADNIFDTSNGIFTINTGTADFIISSNDWGVDADGNIFLNNLTISSGTPIANHISTTALNVVSNSIARQSCDDYAFVTVMGAAVGDTVIATPRASFGGIETVSLSWQPIVSAANMVLIRACNAKNNHAIDTANTQTWRFDIWQH